LAKSDLFDDKERAVLEYTDAVTLSGRQFRDGGTVIKLL
tara:strand:+ start:57 stop:173 length:117 start_codon:yes stop_codon:yes gene_type:complete